MKAVLLDMYGVIVRQTGDDFVPFVQKTFPHLSHDEIYAPWLKADVGELPSLDIWRTIGFHDNPEKAEKDYLDTIELNDGFLDFAKAAREKFKLAIISNDSSEWSSYIREKFDINKYFDVVSVSGDLKIPKPDRRIYDLTVEKLGIDPADCWYVDDRKGNLIAAQNSGMSPVMFNSRNEDFNGAVVNNFKELAQLILK